MAGKDDANDTWTRIDHLLVQVEELVENGYPSIVTAIRHISALRGLERDFEHADIVIGFALNALEAIVSGLVPPTSVASDSERRGRVLAADTLELGYEADGGWDFNAIMRLQHDARRLLTGVDEGPFVPEDKDVS